LQIDLAAASQIAARRHALSRRRLQPTEPGEEQTGRQCLDRFHKVPLIGLKPKTLIRRALIPRNGPAASPVGQSPKSKSGNMFHRPSLECDRSKRKEAVWNAGFRLRNGSDDGRGKRVGGRLVKTLVLQGDCL
jgi:hypothetical protein